MSKTLKEKLFDYEAYPPVHIWNEIEAELDHENSGPSSIVSVRKNAGKKFFYYMAAATLLAFTLILVFHKSSFNRATEFASIDSINNHNIKTAMASKSSIPSNNHPDVKIGVPVFEEATLSNSDNGMTVKNTPAPGGPSEKPLPEKQGRNDSGSSKKSSDLSNHTYITMAGPTGKPVKVSSKIAALINSSDDNSPEKIAWNKKLLGWKNAMNNATLAPTTSNFMDIVELTNTLTDN